MPKSEILTYLKLRGSYGTLGNERIGDYPYQSIIGFSNSLMYQGSTPVMAQSAGVYSFAIYDISWEKTRSYDIGLDAYFFNNRLNLAADVYRKDTEDMLLQLEIPKYVGLSNPYQNAGKMHTNGMELDPAGNRQLQGAPLQQPVATIRMGPMDRCAAELCG